MRRTVLLVSLLVHNVLVEAEWSYSGETGPAYWSKVYPACAETRQSPIEIHHDIAATDETLTSFQFEGYDHTRNHENFTVWNDGYTVTIRVHGDVKIHGGGLHGKYSLKHFHFHWGSTDDEGSEHMVDGKAFPLELHFVHQTLKYQAISDALEDPYGLAVLGVFAKLGKPHPYFQRLIENVNYLDIEFTYLSGCSHVINVGSGDWRNVRPFPMKKLLPNDTETFYRYQGSLTTPPCSESVVWTVFRQPIDISEEQLSLLRVVSAMANVTANYRPVQRLNGRRLYVRKKVDETKETIRTVSVHETDDDYLGDGSSASHLVMSTTALVSVFVISLYFLLS